MSTLKQEKTKNENELKLEITIEAEKFDKAIQVVYNKSKNYFSIPGFRKGKAPYNLVEKQYGASIFYEDAFNEVVPEEYDKLIKENNIDAVSHPKIEIKQMAKGKDLIFEAIVQTRPAVKLGKYKGVEIEKVEYKVTDHDIEHELSHMQEHNSREVEVKDRAVKEGDIAVIDYEGFVDGKAFEGGKDEGHELGIGSHTFIPGFEEGVIGMNTGDEKDVVVTFPKDYMAKELAGKEATFKVKLHAIKVKELPELDDEFAKDASEFDTLKELKQSIKDKMTSENEERAKYEIEERAIKAVSDNVEVNIPSGMIEAETDSYIHDIDQRLAYQGLNFHQYLQMMGQNEKAFRENYKSQAETQVKSRLVLDEIIKEEKIEATKEEKENKLKEFADQYKRDVKELEGNEELNTYIEENIKTEKAIKLIVDNAKMLEPKKEKKDTKKSEDKE